MDGTVTDTPTAVMPTRALSIDVLSTEVLESELVGLAGHLAAGHSRWLRLLAEFDTREGWAGPGLRSCAHWLSWRVGMSLRTGFEQLRVAHALSVLPAVAEAFAAGRLSYSKVRAITRVATPATEAYLLELALAGTASHLERVVRHAVQAASDPCAAAARRNLEWRWDDDGMLVLRGRFTAEQGALLVTALPERAGVSKVGADSQARSAEHSGQPGPEPLGALRADALVNLVTGGGNAAAQVVVVVETAVTDAKEDIEDPEDPKDIGDTEVPAQAESMTAYIKGGPVIPLRVAERIGCTSGVRVLRRDRRGNPLSLGRSRRLASPAQLTALHVRDHGTCQFPGCDHNRYLHAHHVLHWLRGGRTDVDNLVLICESHHRLIHDQGYRVRGRGTELTFHRPDGRRIEPAGAPTDGSLDQLLARHTDATITDETITPTWTGEPLDLTAALTALLPERPVPSAA